MDLSFEKRVAEVYLSKAKHAEKKGIPFELGLMSVRNIVRAKRCYYTGVALTWTDREKGVRATDRTIDRIDNSKGYVKGNVVACSHLANQLKSHIENPGHPFTKESFTNFSKKL